MNIKYYFRLYTYINNGVFGFKLYKFWVLISDDGSRPSKQVGGKITHTYAVYV